MKNIYSLFCLFIMCGYSAVSGGSYSSENYKLYYEGGNGDNGGIVTVMSKNENSPSLSMIYDKNGVAAIILKFEYGDRLLFFEDKDSDGTFDKVVVINKDTHSMTEYVLVAKDGPKGSCQ